VSPPDIQILDSFASLRAQRDQWSSALRAAPDADVFVTLEWFENLAACGLEAANSRDAVCQLWLAGDPRSGPLVCLPLLAGSRLSGLSNYYSSLFGPMLWSDPGAALVSPPAPPALWQALGRAIRQHPARWPVLMLDPLDPQSEFFNQMQRALRLAGYGVDRYFCFGNWYLQVAGRSFAQYAQGLPSPLRHSMERGQRRLGRQGPWSITIQQTIDAELETAIEAFVTVYQRSWKGAEPNPRFIPALVRMAARQGWLRLGVLRLDGQAIAAQLWLVKGEKASIFKLAYVSGFERFSAGSVLTQAMMRQVIEVDRVQEVDYLTGDDAYKRDWMSHRRERWGLVAFDWRTPAGLWAGLRHWLGKKRK
jgi:CelD/BcsL family acetyltransferase involved in cellulose biosynthesis